MIGPARGLAPTTERQKERAERGVRRRQLVPPPGPVPVARPIRSADVRDIASDGYPLWESLETMQLRNRRITIAYHDLAERLATMIAAADPEPDGPRDANWCHFACWSSKSVGTWISADAVPEPLQRAKGPRLVVGALIAATRWLLQRGHGASYRSLAAGNRFVFLEMGTAITLFLEEFGSIDRDKPDELQWSLYWEHVKRTVDQLSLLDPSWLPTYAPEPVDLRLALRQYYEALFCPDPDRRAQLVLAGNVLAVSYEQRRLAGYLSASLALFTDRAMRNLVRTRSGDVGGLRRWPSRMYIRLMTRGLVLNLPGEQLRVGRALPCPSQPPGAPLFPTDLATIQLPVLQALLTRYDLTSGNPRRCRVRDWASYDERMSYITNLFRSRQQCAALFEAPFPPQAEESLLAGRLET